MPRCKRKTNWLASTEMWQATLWDESLKEAILWAIIEMFSWFQQALYPRLPDVVKIRSLAYYCSSTWLAHCLWRPCCLRNAWTYSIQVGYAYDKTRNRPVSATSFSKTTEKLLLCNQRKLHGPFSARRHVSVREETTQTPLNNSIRTGERQCGFW